MTRRWLFADQLGPHFLDSPDQPVLLVESSQVFRRRRFHRQKAHLVLHALRTRARELGEQAVYVRSATYDDALEQLDEPVDVVQPTSYAADRFVRERGLTVLPERGFATTRDDFAGFARGRRRLLLEDFYRWQRTRLGLLMDGDQPAGGRWNYDHDNREPPPRSGHLGVPQPWLASEDDLDHEVREDLDRMVADGSSSSATTVRAGHRAHGRRRSRLSRPSSGRGCRRSDRPRTRCSRLSRGWRTRRCHLRSTSACCTRSSASRRPRVLTAQAKRPWPRSRATCVRSSAGASTSTRSTGTSTPTTGTATRSTRVRALPQWFDDLDAEAVTASCLSHVLHDLRERGWVHHIPRLMVLGNWALQRGYDPAALTAWFHEKFVDGYDWVMLPNVVGMSQHADGGLMATKPYAAGGAYINRMSDYCGGCRYDPRKRLGDDACPYTAGYWAFLDRAQDRLAGNHRMRQPLSSLHRLADRQAVVDQEKQRGDAPP